MAGGILEFARRCVKGRGVDFPVRTCYTKKRARVWPLVRPQVCQDGRAAILFDDN